MARCDVRAVLRPEVETKLERGDAHPAVGNQLGLGSRVEHELAVESIGDMERLARHRATRAQPIGPVGRELPAQRKLDAEVESAGLRHRAPRDPGPPTLGRARGQRDEQPVEQGDVEEDRVGALPDGFQQLPVGVEVGRRRGSRTDLERGVTAEGLLVRPETDAPGLRGLHPVALLRDRQLARSIGRAFGARRVAFDVQLDRGLAGRFGLRAQDQIREAHALHLRAVDLEVLLGLESPVLLR